MVSAAKNMHALLSRDSWLCEYSLLKFLLRLFIVKFALKSKKKDIRAQAQTSSFTNLTNLWVSCSTNP